jgi:hypothetical protein
MIAFITQKCIAANENKALFCECPLCQGDRWCSRPIRLADVLLAIEEKDNDVRDVKIYLHQAFHEVGIIWGNIEACWNLRKDDLTEQSEETINFIAGLLK